MARMGFERVIKVFERTKTFRALYRATSTNSICSVSTESIFRLCAVKIVFVSALGSPAQFRDSPCLCLSLLSHISVVWRPLFAAAVVCVLVVTGHRHNSWHLLSIFVDVQFFIPRRVTAWPLIINSPDTALMRHRWEMSLVVGEILWAMLIVMAPRGLSRWWP
jgi:hypothetical protein